MKMKKIHISIILICVILLFIVYVSNKKEGFNSDYSDFNKIDRIKTSNSKYAYCIAGEVSCISGNLVPIEDDYTGGKTYNHLSDNYSLVECKGNFQYDMTGTQLDWETPTAREISFPFSDQYKGFTVPYSYISTTIKDNYINFWDASNNLLDNINKCKMLKSDSEMEKCISATTVISPNVCLDEPVAPIDEPVDEPIVPIDEPIAPIAPIVCPPKNSIQKCISNYGTKVGDPLCCGQTGVLQKSATEYVCGIDAPICTGYTCGTSFGKCS